MLGHVQEFMEICLVVSNISVLSLLHAKKQLNLNYRGLLWSSFQSDNLSACHEQFWANSQAVLKAFIIS